MKRVDLVGGLQSANPSLGRTVPFPPPLTEGPLQRQAAGVEKAVMSAHFRYIIYHQKGQRDGSINHMHTMRHAAALEGHTHTD